MVRQARKPHLSAVPAVPVEPSQPPAEVRPLREPHRWPCGHALHWVNKRPDTPLPAGHLWTVNLAARAPEQCPSCATDAPTVADDGHQAPDVEPQPVPDVAPTVPDPSPKVADVAPGITDRETLQARADRYQRRADSQAVTFLRGLVAVGVLAFVILVGLVVFGRLTSSPSSTTAPDPAPSPTATVFVTVTPAAPIANNPAVTGPQSGIKGSDTGTFTGLVVVVTAVFGYMSWRKGRR